MFPGLCRAAWSTRHAWASRRGHPGAKGNNLQWRTFIIWMLFFPSWDIISLCSQINQPLVFHSMDRISLDTSLTLTNPLILFLGRAWVSGANGPPRGTRGRPSRGEGINNTPSAWTIDLSHTVLPLIPNILYWLWQILPSHTLTHTHRVIEAFLETGERKETRETMESLDLLDRW